MVDPVLIVIRDYLVCSIHLAAYARGSDFAVTFVTPPAAGQERQKSVVSAIHTVPHSSLRSRSLKQLAGFNTSHRLCAATTTAANVRFFSHGNNILLRK